MSFPLFTRDQHVGFRLRRDDAGAAEWHVFAVPVRNIRRMCWLPRTWPLAHAGISKMVSLAVMPATATFADCVIATAEVMSDAASSSCGREPATLFEVLVQHEEQIGHTRYGLHCDVFERGFDRALVGAFDRALEGQFEREMDALVAAATPEERLAASRDVRIELRGEGAYAWEAAWVRRRLSRFARQGASARRDLATRCAP